MARGGIHLNDLGQYKLYRSVRGAVLRCLKSPSLALISAHDSAGNSGTDPRGTENTNDVALLSLFLS